MSAETTAAVAAAAGPALEMDGLSVSYGRTRVIEELTLAVPRGSVFALLGRNGAGKSSLLRVLLGQRPRRRAASACSARTRGRAGRASWPASASCPRSPTRRPR